MIGYRVQGRLDFYIVHWRGAVHDENRSESYLKRMEFRPVGGCCYRLREGFYFTGRGGVRHHWSSSLRNWLMSKHRNHFAGNFKHAHDVIIYF